MITPEFDRKCAVVLGSPYFSPDDGDPALSSRRTREFMDLKEELQDGAESRDDLSPRMRAVWDAADAEVVELDEKLREGYERFGGDFISSPPAAP